MGEGHRKRTIARVVKTPNVYVHDLLEVLLFRSCPRKDMFDIATNLLSTFGTIDGVLSASVEELIKVEGVGQNVAEYIKVLGLGLSRVHGAKSFGLARSTAEFCRMVTAQNKKDETDLLELYAVDSDGRVRVILPILPEERSKGGILKRLLAIKAYGAFVLRCNGGETVSREELALANTVHEACTAASVRMYDYCISTDEGFYSSFVSEKISGDRV
ncbi:MAG: helix-hairpin-helix domain-containing protein [Candidatus Coproplasma sp.]